jgi:hypothetical protein
MMYHTKRKQPKTISTWLMNLAYYGALLLMSIVFCGTLFAIGYPKVYITDDEVNQRIMSELPSGSTHSQVNDFLRKQNWSSGTPLQEFRDIGSLEYTLTGEEKRKIKWISMGGIREVERTLFGGRSIMICFYYDKDGKLVTYKFQNYGI